jgi:hypothetical protein
MPPDVPPPEDRPPGGIAAPPLATALPPPVLEGGLLDEELPEDEGLALLEELDPAGRMPGVELAGLMPLPGGLGSALATAPSLRGELPGVVDGGVVGKGDISILGLRKNLHWRFILNFSPGRKAGGLGWLVHIVSAFDPRPSGLG